MPFDDSIITKASIASLARRPIRRSGFPLEGALERSHPSIVTRHLERLLGNTGGNLDCCSSSDGPPQVYRSRNPRSPIENANEVSAASSHAFKCGH